MHIRKGVKLLEETEGDGDVVQRQREYILSIRFTLNKGEVLACPPLSFRPDLAQRQHDDGFFDHRTRIDRHWLIPGLFYAVQGMRIGGYRKVAISPHLAYGEKGLPDEIPPHAKLIAEIKVLREAATGKIRWQEPEVPESETVTQEELCRRYDITRLTLWRWRRAGRLPASVLIGAKVRWKQSTLEQWETDDRPRVSPSLDEVNEQTDRAFARLIQLAPPAPECSEGDLAEMSSFERDEKRRLAREIDQHSERALDLMLELALLIDEAGQWNGPALERLLKDGDAAAHHWRNLANILQKSLAGSE
jgi:predicted DNA-binding transcriptional regulator AlpA